MLPFRDRIETEDDLRAVVEVPPARAWAKDIGALDDNCRAFIAHSPFCVLATTGADGTCDASPRGGPPGFARVLDDHRLAFGDLPGNRRQDSHRNLIETGRAALLFMVPGRGETLRVEGRGCLTRDPEVLEAVALDGGGAPALAFGMEVEVAFLHCAKAVLRSRLWRPEDWPDLTDLPSSAAILKDHARADSVESVVARLEESYANTMWWARDGSPTG
jgi:uncharacterized protein